MEVCRDSGGGGKWFNSTKMVMYSVFIVREHILSSSFFLVNTRYVMIFFFNNANNIKFLKANLLKGIARIIKKFNP